MPPKDKKAANGQIVALTGATGFVGGHLLKVLVEQGFTVRALTRKPQPETPGINWIEGALDDGESLKTLLANCDTLIHLAGLTKAISRDAFFDVNVTGSKSLFKAAQDTGVKHVIHVSSLAAREPRLSHYGASKAGTEMLLTARKWSFSWTIVRPPAIYGPGDREILKLLKATKLGVLPAPGGTGNRFSLIHAADLATALTTLCDHSNKQAIVEIDDGHTDGHTGGYDIRGVARAIPDISEKQDIKKTDTGKKTVRVVPLPFMVMGAIGAANDLLARILNRPFMLTLSTARYLCHPDWTVRESRRFKHPEWSPQFDLKAGLEDTLDWYRKNDLL